MLEPVNKNEVIKDIEKEKILDQKELIQNNYGKSISETFYNIKSFNDEMEMYKNPFGDKWSDTVKDIREKSPFKNFETYSVNLN